MPEAGGRHYAVIQTENSTSRDILSRDLVQITSSDNQPCTTTELSILLTSCLIAIKNHIIKYCTTVYERIGKKLFWSFKNSGEILNKLEQGGHYAVIQAENRTSRDILSLDLIHITSPDNQPCCHMGLHARKPVFGVSIKASFKPVSSATETS